MDRGDDAETPPRLVASARPRRPETARDDSEARPYSAGHRTRSAGNDGSARPSRPRSALFGKLRPEGRIRARALEILKQQHSERMAQEDHAEQAKARDERRRAQAMETEKFRERLAEQKEKQAHEERDTRKKRAEAARRRAQRRREEADNERPMSSDPSTVPTTTSTPNDFVRPSSAQVKRPPPVQTGFSPARKGRDSSPGSPVSPGSPYSSARSMVRATFHFSYRGMPRSKRGIAVSLTEVEYSAMTILKLKERISAITGVHNHRSCLMLHDTSSGFVVLNDCDLVSDTLESGAKLLLKLPMENHRDAPPPAAARHQVNEGWVEQQSRAALWKGHRKDEFPADKLDNMDRSSIIRLMRQAGLKVDSACHEADLRKQLAGNAHVWEVERILVCETPDEVLRIPSESGPSTVKTAFRKISMMVHPDKNKSDNASKAMQAVTAAFRSMYLDGSSSKAGPPPPAPAKPASGPPSRPAGPYGYGFRRTSSNSSRFSRTSNMEENLDGPHAPRWGWQEDTS